MKNKILTLICIICIIGSLFTVVHNIIELINYKAPAEDGLKWFEDVDPDVIRHRATGVCYYISDHVICPLFNPDGSLFTLED